jgi:hypothetical protein
MGSEAAQGLFNNNIIMKTNKFICQVKQFAEKNPRSSSAILVLGTAITCGEISNLRTHSVLSTDVYLTCIIFNE